MNSDNQSKSPIADDLSHMRISRSLQCRQCGYDIQGLMADGDCPECCEPVRFTIIECIDPASRRLAPITKPVSVGNAMTCAVLCYFCSILLAVFIVCARSSSILPIPGFVRSADVSLFVWVAILMGLLACMSLIPLMQLCRRGELEDCRTGIMLIGFGLVIWSISMVLIAGDSTWIMHSISTNMWLDTCIPVVASGFIFSGFQRLVPRLGQRSLVFRHAQSSRQRMNDLLAALVILVVGRTVIEVAPAHSNLSVLGLIIIVMSVLLVVVGLGYLLRNVLWIRKSLISPPPALTEILEIIDSSKPNPQLH